MFVILLIYFIYFFQCIFVDSTHRLLFITPDNGETINEVSVRFHPSEISFYENDVNIVLALDKMSPLPSVSIIILHCVLYIFTYIFIYLLH